MRSNSSLAARAGGALRRIGPLGLSHQASPGSWGLRARIVAAIVDALPLAQCIPHPRELDPKVSQARILAPFYRAASPLTSLPPWR